MKEKVLVEFSNMARSTWRRKFPIDIVVRVGVKFARWRQRCHREQCVIINYSGRQLQSARS